MATHYADLHIDKDDLKELIAQGCKLCFVIEYLNADKLTFDVVALVIPTNELVPDMRIYFKKNYNIAATKQAFEPGKIVQKATADILPINFGEAYTIENWTKEPTVHPSAVIPKDSIGLATGHGVEASAVAYLEVWFHGPPKCSPVYFTPVPVAPEKTAIIHPANRVGVWFEAGDIEAGTMVRGPASKHVLDANRSAKYSKGGWVDVA